MSPDPNGTRQSTEQVYERVRGAILDGELAPGTVMSQVSLAEELGISRTPLREALRMLQSEGLIEAEPNRRVRVAPLIGRPTSRSSVIMRVTLEAEAMRLSIPLMTAEDLARLEGHMAEMAHYAEAKDYRRWSVPHQRVPPRPDRARRRAHRRACSTQLFDHAERYRRLHIGHGPSAWATAGHREILDACKAGDRDAAAAAAGQPPRAHGVRGDRAAVARLPARAPRGDAAGPRADVPSKVTGRKRSRKGT